MRMMLLFLALAATMGVPAAERALRPVPLRDVRVTGWIGAKMDNLLRERVLSDWAQNEMMKECEDVFDTKTDGDDVRGGWQGEYWGKTMLGFVRVAEYTGDCRLLDFIRASAHRMMAKPPLTSFSTGRYSLRCSSTASSWFSHTSPYFFVFSSSSKALRSSMLKPSNSRIRPARTSRSIFVAIVLRLFVRVLIIQGLRAIVGHKKARIGNYPLFRGLRIARNCR